MLQLGVSNLPLWCNCFHSMRTKFVLSKGNQQSDMGNLYMPILLLTARNGCKRLLWMSLAATMIWAKRQKEKREKILTCCSCRLALCLLTLFRLFWGFIILSASFLPRTCLFCLGAFLLFLCGTWLFDMLLCCRSAITLLQDSFLCLLYLWFLLCLLLVPKHKLNHRRKSYLIFVHAWIPHT